MSRWQRGALALWLALLLGSGWLLAKHTVFSSDLTAFLPRSSDPAQRLLVHQLKHGVAARTVLIALEGAAPERLAEMSRALAARLVAGGLFRYVANGDPTRLRGEIAPLLRHRYVLSPESTAERFSGQGLRAALTDALQQLASSAGILVKQTLPRDPTGELHKILARIAPGHGPPVREGVWFSRDAQRALLLAETRAPGYAFERQAVALAELHRQFRAVAGGAARLVLAGPPVFTVAARRAIEQDAWRLSALSSGLVLLILYGVYRSLPVLVLAFLPVASGLLAGIAAVGLVFGTVHAITLGFGATLIGEAVDYPSYLLSHVRPGHGIAGTATRLRPTLRLAVLTTACGALAMLLSSFTGLAQLGCLTVAGVLVAGLVTLYILPALAPREFAPVCSPIPFQVLLRLEAGARRWRWLAAPLLLAAAASIAARSGKLWEDDIERLSPVPAAAKQLDADLRQELGAADVRHLLVIRGPSREQVLRHSEALEPWLDAQVRRGVMEGYELVSRYLPSRAQQARRLAVLPEPDVLRANLESALRGLPFRAGLFEPFLADAAALRRAAWLEPQAYAGTALALRLAALLQETPEGWVSLVPLHGLRNGAALNARARGLPDYVLVLDLKTHSERMLRGYRNEAVRYAGLGLLAIFAVLVLGLRRVVAALRVMLPVLLGLWFTLGALAAAGAGLNLFHLVALLLVVGIGINYALFFHRPIDTQAERQSTALALAVCGATTLSAFGTLALSQTPVLHEIGLTVALGAGLALLNCLVLAGRRTLGPHIAAQDGQ
ncbi:MAG: MMPL family transporter [Gammaproteobacteria bacterium]